MKTNFFTLLAVLAISAVGFSQTNISKWKEFDHYGLLLQKTYTSTKSGDFSPIKNNCNTLGELAYNLTSNNDYKEFTNSKNIETLQIIISKTKKLSDIISRGATNKEIKENFDALYKTYERFLSL